MGVLIRQQLPDCLSAAVHGKLLKRRLDGFRFRHTAKLHIGLDVLDESIRWQTGQLSIFVSDNRSAVNYLWMINLPSFFLPPRLRASA